MKKIQLNIGNLKNNFDKFITNGLNTIGSEKGLKTISDFKNNKGLGNIQEFKKNLESKVISEVGKITGIETLYDKFISENEVYIKNFEESFANNLQGQFDSISFDSYDFDQINNTITSDITVYMVEDYPETLKEYFNSLGGELVESNDTLKYIVGTINEEYITNYKEVIDTQENISTSHYDNYYIDDKELQEKFDRYYREMILKEEVKEPAKLIENLTIEFINSYNSEDYINYFNEIKSRFESDSIENNYKINSINFSVSNGVTDVKMDVTQYGQGNKETEIETTPEFNFLNKWLRVSKTTHYSE